MKRVSTALLVGIATVLCGPAAAEISAPSADQIVYENDLTLSGSREGSSGVQWAVRAGTCAAGTNTVAGNVDGMSDDYLFDPASGQFTAMLDISALSAGQYCFVLNFDNGAQRDTQLFYIVDEYAKVSGNLTLDPYAALVKSKAGTHAFQGLIGNAGAEGMVGSISVNYRAMGVQCTFVPGDFLTTGNDPGIELVGLRGNATSLTGTCSDTTVFPNAAIYLLDRDAISNRVAPRGAIVVRPFTAVGTGTFEIDGTPGATGPESWVPLTTGNVHVGIRGQ